MQSIDRRAFLRGGTLAAAGVAAAAAGLVPKQAASAASATTVANLPASFYRRPGLSAMPRIDYASLPIASVRDHGAKGDGVTPDNAAFDAAADAVTAQGGGVVYVPPGRYLFTASAQSPNFWQRTLDNVHIVGEGEQSIIVFQHPGLADPNHSFVTGWSFPDATNMSVRALALTWAPYCLMRDSSGLYTVSMGKANGAQFIGVLVDQGQPGLWFDQGSGYWVVDCVVRNIAADAIHFDSISESTAAYNHVEHVYDDGVANVTNTATVPDPATLPGVQFISNTVVTVPWGRGVTLGGKGEITENNWIESVNSAGIFSTVGIFAGTPSATLYDSSVHDNTMIRNNLAQRDDNAFYKFGTGGYDGSLVLMDLLQGITMERNRIYGSETNGVSLGIDGWYVAKASNIALRDNDIQSTTAAGIHMVAGGTIDGVAISGNTILDTAGASVQVDGTFTDTSTDDNHVSTAPAVSGSVSGDFSGFTVVKTPPRYHDIYGPFRTAADETGWAPAPTWPVRLPSRRVDVRTFGARGDGRTNDTAAFQRALDSLHGTGGVLVVPVGIYRLDPIPGSDAMPYTCIRHHLLIAGTSNVHIQGAGSQSVLRFGSADHHGIRLVDVTNCSISAVRLELADQPPLRHNRALVDVSAARNVVVAQVNTAHSSGPGIRIDSSRQMLVTKSTVDSSGSYGIELAACRQTTVTGCTVTGSRDNGIETSWVGSLMLEPQYIRIADNMVIGSREGAGIGVVGGDNIVASGNTVRDSYLAGLYVYARCANFPPKHIELRSNTLVNTNSGHASYTPGAISLQSLTKGRTSGTVVISGNTVTGTPYAGIWVGGLTPVGGTYSTLDSLTMSGNSLSGFGTKAIDIDDTQRGQIGSLTIS